MAQCAMFNLDLTRFAAAADEVYAVTAYTLFLNNIVPESTVSDAKSLPQINIPNRNGFIRACRVGPHGTR